VDVESGRTRDVLHARPIRSAALSPDGRTLAFVEGHLGNDPDILYVKDIHGGPQREVTEFPKRLVMNGGLDWTAVGRHLHQPRRKEHRVFDRGVQDRDVAAQQLPARPVGIEEVVPRGDTSTGGRRPRDGARLHRLRG